MPSSSPRTPLAIGGGISLLGVGFVFLGHESLPPVLVGAALFLAGALLLGGGVLRADPPHGALLAKASAGFGVAGLALSLLMAGVSPFTGPRSETLGLLTGAVGALAGAILLVAGVAGIRRQAARDRRAEPEGLP